MAQDSGGPDIKITDEDGNNITIDHPEDGQGRPPAGTPFDTNGDGTNDGVVGEDGKVYPDGDGDGNADPGSTPLLDPVGAGGTGGGAAGCVDNPQTQLDECAPWEPGGDACIENPNTWQLECTEGGEVCQDDPTTLANECAPGGGECVDNPATPVDECGPGGGGNCDPEEEECGEGGGECDPETGEGCGVGLMGCEEAPSCQGDPLECALIHLQWETACQFYVSPTFQGDDRNLLNAREEDRGEFLWKDITELEEWADVELDFSMPSGGECPAPYQLDLLGSVYEVEFGPICELMSWAGLLVFVAASIAAIRIVAGA